MLSDYYTTEFTVMRHSDSQDAGGAVTDSTSANGTGEGFLEQLKAGERLEDEKIGLRASYRLYCPSTVDVTEKDEIVISGTTYRVVYVIEHLLGENIHLEVYLEI